MVRPTEWKNAGKYTQFIDLQDYARKLNEYIDYLEEGIEELLGTDLQTALETEKDFKEMMNNNGKATKI